MSYKKWILKYKWLQEEIVDVNNLLKKYVKEFNEDFEDNPDEEKIRQQAINKEKIENLKEEQEEQEETIKEDKPGKKLYKQLSKIYHPDRKTGDEDKFKLISKLYKSGNILGLILEATELDFNVKDYIEDVDHDFFEKNCNELEEEIISSKNTLAWHWSTMPEKAKNDFKSYILKTQPIKERK